MNKMYFFLSTIKIICLKNYRCVEQVNGCQGFGMAIGRGALVTMNARERESIVVMEQFCTLTAVAVTCI